MGISGSYFELVVMIGIEYPHDGVRRTWAGTLDVDNVVFGIDPEDLEVEAGPPLVAHVTWQLLAAIDSSALPSAADISRPPKVLRRSVRDISRTASKTPSDHNALEAVTDGSSFDYDLIANSEMFRRQFGSGLDGGIWRDEISGEFPFGEDSGLGEQARIFVAEPLRIAAQSADGLHAENTAFLL